MKWTKIGDKEYVTGIMPDGREWMCQNLDYVSAKDGIVVGTNCWYYDNNQSTYGWNGKKYGLLYTLDAAMAINIDGWHVPSNNEWDALATACGGASICGTKLKSTYDWSNGAGTDNYGFNGVAAGHRGGNGTFYNLGAGTIFWTSTKYNDTRMHVRYLDASAGLYSTNYDNSNGFLLRLVKDSA